ncbi:50S ribosomal protein L19 [Candidatus Peregrinibacteria bacterium]|nr:50S ribosomal protein L19 [Candidatus Peregrinibacteria bacterium]
MHPTIEAATKANLKKVPEIKTGYTVEVSQKVTEGSKERIQKFQGLVIKVGHGAGVEKTFTVRKIVEGIGVEKVFPFHSPNITKIRIIKKANVRRQKLYYMRERFGKSARLSEKHVTDEERAAEEAKMEALYAEAVEAEKKRLAEEAKAKGEEVPAEEEIAEEGTKEEVKEGSTEEPEKEEREEK